MINIKNIPLKQTLLFFIFLFLSVFIAVVSSDTTNAASTSNFQAGNIISDSIFTNYNSMSKETIQTFLNSKNANCDTNGTQPASEFGRPDLTHAQYAALHGWSPPPYTCLKDYSENGKSSAQIIYDISQQYKISPAVFIVLLQKEQGLVTDSWPLATQYRTATGYGCPDTAPCDSEYYGFTNQVKWSGTMFRAIMNDSPTWYTPYILDNNYIQWSPNYSCGGSTVYIQNRATKALYNYTPYQPNQTALNAGYGTGDACSAYGNRNFWLYFTDWFGSTTVELSNVYIPNGVYSIVNPSTNKAIDVAQNLTQDGTRVWIYGQNNTVAQSWKIERESDGFYTIKNIRSNKYLDVIGAGTMPGTKIQIWTGNTGCAQRWSAVSVNGNITFLNKCSGLALDIYGGRTDDTTPLQIYNRNNTSAQSWRLINKDAPAISNGFYKINSISGLSVNIDGTELSSGSSIEIQTSTDTPNQYWQITRLSDGTYTIRNPLSNKYLDVMNEAKVNGTAIQLWNPNITSCAQKWTINKISDNTYSITSSCSGLALDITSGTINTVDTRLQLYESNSTEAQTWSFSSLNTIPNGDYSIKSISNLALDVINGSTVDGANMQLWKSNHSNAQKWTIASTSASTYTIKNIGANKFIDLPGANIYLNSKLQIWPQNNTCAQTWKITEKSKPYFKIESSCLTGSAMDIMGGQYSTVGVKIQNYASNSSLAQTWYFDAP